VLEQAIRRLESSRTSTAVAAFNAAKARPHTAYNGNLAEFVEDTARLAEQLRP
jgi:hypothetical protein